MRMAEWSPRHRPAASVVAVEAVERIDLAGLDVGDGNLGLVADLGALADAPSEHDLVAQLRRAGGDALGGKRDALADARLERPGLLQLVERNDGARIAHQ